MGRMKELSMSLQEIQDHLDCISSLDLESLIQNIEVELRERALEAELLRQNGEKVLDSDTVVYYN